MEGSRRSTKWEWIKAGFLAAAAVIANLEQRGASFFSDLVAGSGRLRSEVEDALAEGIFQGLVTSDGYSSLRSIVGGGRVRRAPGARGLCRRHP